jgi:hypothetical protein
LRSGLFAPAIERLALHPFEIGAEQVVVSCVAL